MTAFHRAGVLPRNRHVRDGEEGKEDDHHTPVAAPYVLGNSSSEDPNVLEEGQAQDSLLNFTAEEYFTYYGNNAFADMDGGDPLEEHGRDPGSEAFPGMRGQDVLSSTIILEQQDLTSAEPPKLLDQSGSILKGTGEGAITINDYRLRCGGWYPQPPTHDGRAKATENEPVFG